jgi:ADP-ribose pyrophosphatase YjhB (NUDIX family)
MITCAFKDGGQVKLRHAAIKVIITKNNQVFLIKRNPTSVIRPNKWDLPGGFLDHGERLLEGVKREVGEETGLELVNPRLFLINDKPDKKNEIHQNIDFIYVSEATGTPEINLNENIAGEWFDMKNLPDESEFAFDHDMVIKEYMNWLKHPVPLPIMAFNY